MEDEPCSFLSSSHGSLNASRAGPAQTERFESRTPVDPKVRHVGWAAERPGDNPEPVYAMDATEGCYLATSVRRSKGTTLVHTGNRSRQLGADTFVDHNGPEAHNDRSMPEPPADGEAASRPAGVPPAAPSGQVSPDGRWLWDGSRWLPTGQPAAQTQPQMVPLLVRGRSLSSDRKFWWDGQRWLPYRAITWNSLHLRLNPPEDHAILSRNLGIWCLVFGILALAQVALGAFSILAAIAGPVSLYNGVAFFRANRSVGDQLPGARQATLGIVLSSIGLIGFALAVTIWIARSMLR